MIAEVITALWVSSFSVFDWGPAACKDKLLLADWKRNIFWANALCWRGCL